MAALRTGDGQGEAENNIFNIQPHLTSPLSYLGVKFQRQAVQKVWRQGRIWQEYFLTMITACSHDGGSLPLVCCRPGGTTGRTGNSSGCVQSPNKGSSDHCPTLLYLETSSWVSSSNPRPHHSSQTVWNTHSSLSVEHLTLC